MHYIAEELHYEGKIHRNDMYTTGTRMRNG